MSSRGTLDHESSYDCADIADGAGSVCFWPKADDRDRAANVRLWPKADIRSEMLDVRFWPIEGCRADAIVSVLL